MKRRAFITVVGSALAATQLGCAPLTAARSGTRRLRSVGVQLYSLRDAARRDLERTLADVAAVGYRDVELLASMGNFGMQPAALRRILDRNGLRAPSTHIAARSLDELERLVDEAQTLGHRYLVLADLPLPARPDADAIRRGADRLNEVGQRTLQRGVHLAIHNHTRDHTAVNGVVPYDLLVERTDPSVVRLQLDTGNAAMAGLDPLTLLQRHGDRYWLFHLKDVPQLGAANDTELGNGIVDFRRLLSAIEGLDDKLLFVEQETYPGTPLDSVRRDYRYISTLDFPASVRTR